MPPPGVKKRLPKMAPKGPKKSCMKKFARIMFSHVGLFIIVTIYAVVGAYILIGIEKPNEESNREKKEFAFNDLNEAKKYIIKYMWAEAPKNHSQIDYKAMAEKNLRIFHTFVVAQASNGDIQYDGFNGTFSYNWDFKNSLLFTFTTMAAIGYGHISPKTFNGQMFTLFYGVIGVPMLLVFLANIGDPLGAWFRIFYSRMCCRWCRVKRKLNEVKKNQTAKKGEIRKENVGAETYMPTDEVNVPITMNLLLLSSYLCLGGWLFSWWEGWTVIEAVYFTFITLTTIGFGDYVPGASFGGDGMMAYFSIFVTCCFILFGMALVSMCINLMQEQMIMKAKNFAKSLGIGKSKPEEDLSVKYKVTKKRPESVMVTPKDKDGNRPMTVSNVEEGQTTTQQYGRTFSANSNDLKLHDF